MTNSEHAHDFAPPIDGLAIDDATQRRLFLEARSNTEFAEGDVPDSVIRNVFDLIKWGPTANNTTPMRVAIARSEAARSAVIDNALEGNRAKLSNAPVLLVVARDDRFHDHFSVTSPGSEGSAERLEAAPERRTTMATTGSWLQAGYLIVGLRAAGLAVRPYGGFDKEGLDNALFSDTSWGSIALLGVGYPSDSEHGAGPRKGRVSNDVGVASL
ncbi:malonic semialdehyde reductase [Demequina aurantiaca]|uniref:malonic semialdehyde reductase n=1 Tax=Demequina aurantiaca TaxID=676200 RepID=UPI000A06E606|nr:malonic semialdehyde reductase [Demequina aurantiaca]